MACLMENYNRVKAQSAVGEAPFSCKLCFCKILAKIKFILLPRGTYIYISFLPCMEMEFELENLWLRRLWLTFYDILHGIK